MSEPGTRVADVMCTCSDFLQRNIHIQLYMQGGPKHKPLSRIIIKSCN